jgi:hypothetical protein
MERSGMRVWASLLGRKYFFFEKKKQKTFVFLSVCQERRDGRQRGFAG